MHVVAGLAGLAMTLTVRTQDDLPDADLTPASATPSTGEAEAGYGV